MMLFLVDENVIKVTLKYLATRPYQEVFQLIQALSQSKPEVKVTEEEGEGGGEE